MELLNNCRRLHDYAYFVNEVNQNLKKGYPFEKSIYLAMAHCEKSDILRDILGKQRSEVFHLLLNEFDIKIYERGLKAEGKAECIIELLEEVGEVPDTLQSLIMRQTNLETLSQWHKLAAKAQAIEDFEKAIGLVK